MAGGGYAKGGEACPYHWQYKSTSEIPVGQGWSRRQDRDSGRSEYLRVDDMMYGMRWDIEKNDPFDRQANEDIDCMMKMMIDPKNDHEYSLKNRWRKMICLSMMKR
jgi:hypothetical protein